MQGQRVGSQAVVGRGKRKLGLSFDFKYLTPCSFIWEMTNNIVISEDKLETGPLSKNSCPVPAGGSQALATSLFSLLLQKFVVIG